MEAVEKGRLLASYLRLPPSFLRLLISERGRQRPLRTAGGDLVRARIEPVNQLQRSRLLAPASSPVGGGEACPQVIPGGVRLEGRLEQRDRLGRTIARQVGIGKCRDKVHPPGSQSLPQLTD